MPELSPAQIIDRIRQAYDVTKRLPEPRTPRITMSPWSDSIQTWTEAVWSAESLVRRDARGRPILGKDVWRTPQTHWAKGFNRPAPPTAQEIDAADEALGWLTAHLTGQRELLLAAWFCHGANLGPSEAARAIATLTKTKPVSRETIRHRRDQAISLVCRGVRISEAPPNQRLNLRLKS